MNQNEIIVQISTGGYLEHKVTQDQICAKLEKLLQKVSISKVIIGWSCERQVYEAVIRFLKLKGIECYLWLPVFSETGILKGNVGRLLDDTGTEVKSYCLSEGENFEFYCPNQSGNIESFLEIYEAQFEGLDFDGVFIDKIRYGAFSNGLGGVLNCFCPSCMERYEALGIDVKELKNQMKMVRGRGGNYKNSVLGIRSYHSGKYTFQHPVWEAFFEKKAEDIERALKIVTDYFHNKGMKVGMDTFAPYLAYFAGQDIRRLAPMADFIKPMMYRITGAPAGMPFETDCLLSETVGRQGKGGCESQAREELYRILGCRDMGNRAFDLEFTARELAYMSGLDTPVYCGIEVNQSAVAASTPEYIWESMEGFQNIDIQGYVLSWDLMSATDENLNAVAAYLDGQGR